MFPLQDRNGRQVRHRGSVCFKGQGVRPTNSSLLRFTERVARCTLNNVRCISRFSQVIVVFVASNRRFVSLRLGRVCLRLVRHLSLLVFLHGRIGNFLTIRMIHVRRLINAQSAQFSRVIDVGDLGVEVLVTLTGHLTTVLLVRDHHAFTRRLRPTPIRQLTTAASAATQAYRGFSNVVKQRTIFSFFGRSANVTRAVYGSCFCQYPVRICYYATGTFRPTRFFGVGFEGDFFHV